MSTGIFTGMIKLDGTVISMVANFDINGLGRSVPLGNPSIIIKRTGKPEIEVTLQLDMSRISGQMLATLKQRVNGIIQAVSYATLYRAHYSFLYRVPTEFAGVTNQRYNVLLLPQAVQSGLTSSQFPQGTGISSITVTTTGNVQFTASLPDGTVCSASMPLSRVFTCSLFSSLYASKGCFAAAISIDLTKPETDLTAMNSFWVRPAQTNASGYRGGWPNGIIVDVVGSKYTPPVTTAPVIPNLGAADANLGNITLNFSDGRLSLPISFGMNLLPPGTFSFVPGTPMGTAVSFNRLTGQVTGRFMNNASATTSSIAFNATTLQKPGTWQGVQGFFLSPVTKPADGLVESGKAYLLPR